MRKTKTKLSKVFALALVFVMVMSSVVSAAPAPGRVISNELEATFNVTEATSEVVDVEDLAEFTAALADNEVKTINIMQDIVTTEEIVVSRPVTINGSDHAIKFTGDVNDWQGDYVLHVYKTTGVIIGDIKLTGADAGLLVNGSEVTLTGEIDVTGNEFGGIESSMGTGVTTKPSLNVTGSTLANISEAYGLPTIWEDGVSGTVVSNLTQIGINGQQQYYLATSVIPVTLTGLDGEIAAKVGDVEDYTITATMVEGVRSVENARLAIEVTCAGIAIGDFEFTSIVGGTEGGTSEENAAWLNDTVTPDTENNKLTFFWGPEEGSTINKSIVTQAFFKFNKAGNYTFNIQLIQVK